MNKCNYHWEFHFERVLKIKSVLSDTPNWLDKAQILESKYLHAEELIVDKTAVDTHCTHKIKEGAQFE